MSDTLDVILKVTAIFAMLSVTFLCVAGTIDTVRGWKR